MAKTRTVLGLQVQGEEARVLLAEVSESGFTPLQSRTVQGAEGLVKLLRSLPKRPSAVVCGLPLEQGAIRTANLPPTTDENLERVVALEAETALPLGTEDLALAHHMLGMNEQSRLEVMLVAARQESVHQALRMANAAPYIAAQATLAPIALMNALQQLRGGARENVCAVLNIEEHYSELLILDRGRVLSAQSLPVGCGAEVGTAVREPVAVGAAGAEAEAVPESLGPVWLTQLTDQLRYPLQAISYERGFRIERLWICGAGAARANVDWQISQAFDLPVSILAPPGSSEMTPAYAVAYGCAVQAAGLAAIALNLTPARVTIAREVEQRRQNTLSWGALAAAVVAALLLVYAASLYRLNQAVAVAEAKVKELGTGITAPPLTPKELGEAEKAVNAAVEVRVPPAKLISTLSEQLPQDVWIQELSYNAESGLKMTGVSKTPAGPQQAAVALLAQQLFDEVTLDSVTEDRIDETRVWTYQISGKLRPKQVQRRGTRR